MNSTQRSVAMELNLHFKRQWRQMARSGSVERVQADQNETIARMTGIFKAQNPGFLADEFSDLCTQGI